MTPTPEKFRSQQFVSTACRGLQQALMEVGSKVRIIGVPDGLEDYLDFPRFESIAIAILASGSA